MELEINIGAVNRVLKILKLLLHLIYRIEYRNAERLQQAGGFLVVANHQERIDIPFEGLLLKEKANRHAFYVMQANLPKSLRRLGGLSIVRRKEVFRVTREAKQKAKLALESGDEELRRTSRQARINELNAAREVKEEIYATVLNLLMSGQIVIMHPQKTRRKNQQFEPQLDVLREIVGLGAKLVKAGYQGLTVVPVQISYQNAYLPRSRITLTVGEPILLSGQVTAQALKEHLLSQIQTRKPGSQNTFFPGKEG